MLTVQDIGFLGDRRRGLISHLRLAMAKRDWLDVSSTARMIDDIERQLREAMKHRRVVERDPDVVDLKRRESLRLVE